MGRIAAGWKRFLGDEQGPTAVEYAVMVCLLVIASMATISALGRDQQAGSRGMGGRIAASQ